jgi:ER lumen protein retaining receptor
MEYDIHTLLDASTLAATIWVVYMMRFTGLKQAYQKEQDIVNQAYVVCIPDVAHLSVVLLKQPALQIGPCVVVAFMAHPTTSHHYTFRVCHGPCRPA